MKELPTARGQSLHIGLNLVDPKRYGGWDGQLWACENDARDMTAIAKQAGFDTHTLLGAEATVHNLKSYVENAAQTLTAGDAFLLTYAGHGGQVPDVNGDEDDGKDETWCLFDRQFLDDELAFLWAHFEPGVRVTVFSDSCHSGSVTRSGEGFEEMTEAECEAAYGTRTPVFRNAPDDAIQAAYRELAYEYDRIQQEIASYEATIEASVRLLSGCQDNQRSSERDGNGLFTGSIKRLWQNGAFRGTYDALHQQIIAQMPEKQTPNHLLTGHVAANAAEEPAFAVAWPTT